MSGWGSGQVPIFCQFSGSRAVHVHMLFQRSHTRSAALLQSHATLLAPAAQHWRHFLGQARPKSGFVVLWKTIATALEITEISNSKPPRKDSKRTNRHILQEIDCPARSTLFITNGLPRLCLRNKTKKNNQRKTLTLRSYFKTFSVKQKTSIKFQCMYNSGDWKNTSLCLSQLVHTSNVYWHVRGAFILSESF